MSNGSTTKTTPVKPVAGPTDWTAYNAMTDEERHAAALNDPDAQPIDEEKWKRMKRTPRAKTIRRALGLSQEEFAARYQIPLSTLRDWEEGRAEPDLAARAYLKVIAREPEVVRKALITPRVRDRRDPNQHSRFSPCYATCKTDPLATRRTDPSCR